jgi:ABC-type Fe3+-hydroxamate transport system substrate-binding protein
MPVFIDQTGRVVSLTTSPRSIISIVPSQTELLYDLGLNDEVIGITKFCVHPEEWYSSKIKVGGTKQLKIELIRQLEPDLILANKEENVKEQIEILEKSFPVWVSNVHDLNDALTMIYQIGLITEKENRSNQIINQVKENFSALSKPITRLSAAYLIWKDPYMTVGGDTFIHAVMESAGFENVFKHKTRYPEITYQELIQSGCDILLLASEPFPFQQKHMNEIRSAGFSKKMVLVDGEMFSWYGSRLVKAPSYFIQLQKQISQESYG